MAILPFFIPQTGGLRAFVSTDKEATSSTASYPDGVRAGERARSVQEAVMALLLK
jgi:hypothetical protein